MRRYRGCLMMALTLIMLTGLCGCGNAGNPVRRFSLKNKLISMGDKAQEMIRPEQDPDFTGEWKDVVSGNTIAAITHDGEDGYSIVIERYVDDRLCGIWEMRGVYYRSTGLMEYGDAVYRIMDDKGEKQVYENGDGYFSIDERGDMEWRSGVSDIDGADALLMEKK